MKKPRGIRIRLIFMLILLLFIPILLFAAVSQLRLNSAMRESLDSRVQTGLEKSNRSLTLTLEKYDTLLYDLSTDDDIIDMVESLNAGGKNEEMLKINLRRELKHICNRNEGVTGLAIFTRDGNCIYYDGLSSSSSESLWLNSSMNLLQDKMEMYQPVKYVMAAPDTPVYVFSIQRRLIDYRDIHKEVGSILICVNEKVLQKAMERISGEVYYLEQDGRILSAPDDTLIGASIGCDEFWYIGNKKYQDYVVAFAENEVSGWNIVEFYSMEHYRKTMFDQFLLQIGLVLGVGVVLVAAVLIVTRPVIVSVEDMLKAMNRVEEGDFSTRVEKRKNMPAEMNEIADGFNEMVNRTDLLLGQVRQAALEQKNAEISALEAQIDPHFLYNTLDTINWKAIEKEEYEISEMVGDLGDILRYAIKNAGGITTLGEEIAWLKKYVRLQQEKLGQEIQIFCSLDSIAAKSPMHKLLLQPIAENSIKHGLHGIDRAPLLMITGRREMDGLIIEVEDNGRGMPPELLDILNQKDYHRENHFGIENARKRLRLYYGEAAALHFESSMNKYTKVTLFIPILEGQIIENCDS